MTKAKTKTKTDDELVTGPVLAKRLGLTATSVSRLATGGKLSKASRGKYWAWASVRMYIKSVNESASARQSPAALARGKLVEFRLKREMLQYDRERGGLVDANAFAKDLHALLGALSRAHGSMPTRLAYEAGLDRAGVERFKDMIRVAQREFVDAVCAGIPDECIVEGEAMVREARARRKK
jgi:hypothetical protein